MSLNGALLVGKSALLTSQAAMQVTGNNMANAATPGYSRRSIHLAPLLGQRLSNGAYAGQGVQLMGIRREIDFSLLSRHRDALSQQHKSLVDQSFLNTMESLHNELTDNDLSSQLGEFFSAFSELANNPTDSAVRSVVIEQGQTLATSITSLRQEYNTVLDQIDDALGNSVLKVNELLDEIAQLNGQIATLEPAAGESASLRDQRDLLVDELATFVDVSVVEQESGAADILVGSIPVVLGGESRGVMLKTTNVGGETRIDLRVEADGTTLTVNAGQIGGLLEQRAETVDPMIDKLNTFAAQLIFQVNKVHAQGQGKVGFESVSGTYAADDPTAVMNTAASGLPFPIENGSFHIHVTNKETGTTDKYEIFVNGDTDSLQDVIDQINATAAGGSVTASLSADNTLALDADAGYSITFSNDTSGALAALGVNTFFTGEDASTIGVNDLLVEDPNLLAAGLNNISGSNGTALALADLQEATLDELGGVSLGGYWSDAINDLGVRTSAANAAVESTTLVAESLSAQIQSVSGVSVDEESINLLMYQRQFQAATRFITTIDETLQTLLSIA